ncbi:3-deoxy-manno-octulosonate cytidylyltransferase [Nitrincola tapanii]|uniref:3-deoxy-manno-octulosonate cytidylyltransferase n=1 Tax=Nitrincola tapanii TaxID=1708751 RepID=A0A5A9W4D1_9GAMM|nr:3-deoxy-manno-octulosonate cytidylyltransferase [Nitrincola tapanii]KAA0874401.1 3-deoxy-manno-octulosonate cytidylyltransferase [Nitrincola tapanii]
MKVLVVIPARYASSRFPGKPLALLLGKPMILWVAELAARAVGLENICIATDDRRIASIVEGAGYPVAMTSSTAATGTDRLAEVAAQIHADIYVNVQGDEPMLNPTDIHRVIAEKIQSPDQVINAYTPISSSEDPHNPNLPKVIFNELGNLVYMSRQALPGFKDIKNAPSAYYKQVCIYAFNKEELLAFSAFGRKSTLEFSEDIEILRFLELGKSIKMVPVSKGSLAVDVPGDISLVESALAAIGSQ